MPKENKHARGRRGTKEGKRKRSDEQDEEHQEKRQKSDAEEEIQFIGTDNTELVHDEAHSQDPMDRPFFGLLDDEEQEYFRHADELLELNDFPSPEEQSLFLANVFKEAEGKELKIANSQSCSRLMERLILLSTTDQKKTLFEKFAGHFLHLVPHRFASHCCEALFLHSAYVVTQELIMDSVDDEGGETKDGEVVHVSMETLFLNTLSELDGHMGFLLTDRFASHVLRVLLVVLSGQSLAKSSTRSLLQSKKKEKISITGLEPTSAELSLKQRAVPESFEHAIDKIISGTARALDSTFIHIIATHPTGNPTLQLLLELEFKRQSKQKPSPESASILSRLLPDDISTPNSKSSSFINGLIYEPIGSRLLETIVQFAPGKLFKQLYRTTFKERIGSLARNDIASYVVIKVLDRLSKADLEECVTLILPQIPSLIERSRTTVIKTLLERCQARNALDSITLLTNAIDESYGSDPNTLLLKMTNIDLEALSTSSPDAPSKNTKPDLAIIHGSLLAQTMLSIPGPPTTLLQTSILALPPTTLVLLACSKSPSQTLQASLKPTSENLSFRRKLINTILGAPSSNPPQPHPTPTQNPNPNLHPKPQPPILTLALSKVGSHVLDVLFTSTHQLMNLKERICAILLENKEILQDDFVGRVVLRVWMVELFGRRREEWVRRVRASHTAADTGTGLASMGPMSVSVPASVSVPVSVSMNAVKGNKQELQKQQQKQGDALGVKKGRNRGMDGDGNGDGDGGKVKAKTKVGREDDATLEKTAIELARERFAAAKLKGGRRLSAAHLKRGKARGKGKGTGANASVVL